MFTIPAKLFKTKKEKKQITCKRYIHRYTLTLTLTHLIFVLRVKPVCNLFFFFDFPVEWNAASYNNNKEYIYSLTEQHNEKKTRNYVMPMIIMIAEAVKKRCLSSRVVVVYFQTDIYMHLKPRYLRLIIHT